MQQENENRAAYEALVEVYEAASKTLQLALWTDDVALIAATKAAMIVAEQAKKNSAKTVRNAEGGQA